MTTYLLDQGDTLEAIKSGLVAGDIVDGRARTGNPMIRRNS